MAIQGVVSIINLCYTIDYCTSDPEAEAVVLLHGLGLNAQTWEPLIASLTERYHVYRYHLRGHGESTHDGTELTWELLCKELDGLFNECGLAEAHMIGHGFGGTLAARYGVSRLERIKSYILISTVGFYSPEVMQRSSELRRSYARKSGPAELAEQMSRLVTCLPQSSVEAAWIKEAYLQCDLSVYFQLIDLFAASNPLDDLSAINKPCLVMAGAKDTLYPSFMSEITSQFIPNAQFITVQDAASMLFVDDPVYTARKMLEFLSNSHSNRGNIGIGDPQLGFMSRDAMALFGNVYAKSPSKEVFLQVKLMGTFEVTMNGKEIRTGWQQRNAKRLLVYLLFHPYAAREQICEELWPEADTSKASNLLRVSLSHLKSLFEAAGGSPILAERRHIKLNAVVECDMLSWIRLLHEARSEESPSRKILLVKELLSYSVIELLPDLYDEWVLQERNRLEYFFLDLVESLTESYSKDVDNPAVYQVVRRLQNMLGVEMLNDVENHVQSQGGGGFD